jgi:hypothetical protein
MTASTHSLRRDRAKKLRFYVIYFACLLLFTAGVAEVLARLTGHRPWVVKQANIRVEPGGRLFRIDPNLGYTNLPGRFKITLDDTYTYTVTNSDNTLRITQLRNAFPRGKDKKEIWVFGDSITYGQSVNDEETFCWLLQDRFPNYEFVNFGVQGYGNLHSLIQLKKALQTRAAPRLVLLDYASWQDVRNTFLRGWKKNLSVADYLGPVNQPYARLKADGSLDIAMDSAPYRAFPLMRYSAFSNALEEAYDRYEERHARSHEVTKAIIKEMAVICKSHGIEMAVAGLTSDPLSEDMLRYCETQGIKTVAIWVDLSKKENTNLPYDSHPNANAHKLYAAKLESFLKAIL